MRPKIRVGDESGRQAAIEMMHHIPQSSTKNIIMDAGYHSNDMMSFLENNEFKYIISCPSNSNPWLWETLSHNLPPSHNRIGFNNSNKRVASIHCQLDNTGNSHYQQLMTNIIACEKLTQQYEEPKDELELLANVASLSPTIISSNIDPLTLRSMKLPSLKNICKQLKIKPQGKKSDIVSKISGRIQRINQEKSEFHQLRSAIETHFFLDPASIHDTYKSHFNAVDLVDRLWYSVDDSNSSHCWENQLLIGLLRNITINYYTLRRSRVKKSFIEIRQELARNLINQN